MIFHSYVNVYQRVPLFFVIFQYFPLCKLFFGPKLQVSTLQSPDVEQPSLDGNPLLT